MDALKYSLPFLVAGLLYWLPPYYRRWKLRRLHPKPPKKEFTSMEEINRILSGTRSR